MLVILSYPQLEFTPAVFQDLDRIAKRDNIDQIVIWTALRQKQEIRDLLKRHHVTIIHIQDNEISDIQQLNLFVIDDGVEFEELLPLNILCDVLTKRLKKLFHLVLSEIAAPIYDELYGHASIATNKVKTKEEVLLEDLCKSMRDENKKPLPRAIDVGCGTGRHTFMLAKYFSEIYAFDFSHKMIEEATKFKKSINDRKIHFMVADFEHEDFTGMPIPFAQAGTPQNTSATRA